MRYFDYGTFSGADLAGNSTGDFKSKEYAFTVAKSHTINHFTLGASLNLAFPKSEHIIQLPCLLIWEVYSDILKEIGQ